MPPLDLGGGRTDVSELMAPLVSGWVTHLTTRFDEQLELAWQAETWTPLSDDVPVASSSSHRADGAYSASNGGATGYAAIVWDLFKLFMSTLDVFFGEFARAADAGGRSTPIRAEWVSDIAFKIFLSLNRFLNRMRQVRGPSPPNVSHSHPHLLSHPLPSSPILSRPRLLPSLPHTASSPFTWQDLGSWHQLVPTPGSPLQLENDNVRFAAEATRLVNKAAQLTRSSQTAEAAVRPDEVVAAARADLRTLCVKVNSLLFCREQVRPIFFISSRLTSSHPISSRLTSSHPISSRLTPSHPISSRLTPSHPVSSRLFPSLPVSSRPLISPLLPSHLASSHRFPSSSRLIPLRPPRLAMSRCAPSPSTLTSGGNGCVLLHTPT
jgi:hypothetical protein